MNETGRTKQGRQDDRTRNGDNEDGDKEKGAGGETDDGKKSEKTRPLEEESPRKNHNSAGRSQRVLDETPRW